MTEAPNVSSRAVDAWMSAVAAHGWRGATLEQAALVSGLAADDLRGAGDRIDALAAFQDRVAAEAALGASQTGGSVRDCLFDGLMRGFDSAQTHRAAVLAIWSSRDPGVALLLSGRAGLHVRRLALAAGIDVSGVRGQLRLAGLAGLIAQAFAAWRGDESADMAATMAELDRLLERAERAETEGLSPDLIGLPGLSALVSRLPLTRATGGQARPPSGDPALE